MSDDSDDGFEALFDGIDDTFLILFSVYKMPLKISQDARAAVVGDWLNGKPRDTIARDNSLSAGSVSSIISEWRDALTLPVANDLRELGIML
jgi:hypothetical protein